MSKKDGGPGWERRNNEKKRRGKGNRTETEMGKKKKATEEGENINK